LLLDKRYLVLLPREPPKTIQIQNLSSSGLKKTRIKTGFKQEIRKVKKSTKKACKTVFQKNILSKQSKNIFKTIQRLN